jgi:hypothetical protein
MVTDDNLALLAETGYPYIVGYHKRGRVVSDQLLEAYPDVNAFAQLHDELLYLEVDSKILPTDEKKDEGVRYILFTTRRKPSKTQRSVKPPCKRQKKPYMPMLNVSSNLVNGEEKPI